MRGAAVPGVAGPLLGRWGRERAPGSGVSGAGVGRGRVSADCDAVVDVVVCCRGWHACWTLQDDDTAVLLAAFRGKVEAMALVLDRGADLEAKTKVSFSGRASQLLPRLR